MVRRLDEERGSILSVIDNRGVRQKTNAVNEPGLYEVIFMSRKPEAKAFKRWVTHEVLPSIREHGMYATPATIEDMIADLDIIIQPCAHSRELTCDGVPFRYPIVDSLGRLAHHTKRNPLPWLVGGFPLSRANPI